MRTRKILVCCGLVFGIAAVGSVWTLGVPAEATIIYSTEAGQCGYSEVCPGTSTCIGVYDTVDVVQNGPAVSGSTLCGTENDVGEQPCGPTAVANTQCPP